MDQETPLTYVFELAGRRAPVRAIRGAERLTRPFRFEVTLTVVEPLDPREILRAPAVLRLDRAGHARRLTGVITRAVLEATPGDAHRLQVVFEPALALLRHRIDIRHFRGKSAPEIVAEVLRGAGLAVETRLGEAYPRRDFCVQMRESDLDFVHRLLEDEGIFYLLGEDGEVILGDSPAAYDPIEGDRALPYLATPGLDAPADHVLALDHRAELTPARVTLRDFDPERPALDQERSAPVEGAVGEEEWYDYPGEYVDPREGERRARRMAESFARNAAGIGGRAASARIAPGRTFTLVSAPETFADGDLVVTALTHAWDERRRVDLAFEAIGGELAARPARVTEVPRIWNPVTGFVSGPPGEDIHTDAWGRVKVHFHWDRQHPQDDSCSHWVPTVQDTSGRSSSIPRIGWEVAVHFLEGDPDRPVVLGRVYNPRDPYPHNLPINKTRTSIRSQTSPGRVGFNELTLEDAAGGEFIALHAERDLRIAVANDKRETVGGVATREIGRDEAMKVGADDTVTVDGSADLEVHGNQAITIGGARRRSTGSAETATVEGDHALTVGAIHTRRIGSFDTVSAKDLHETVGAVIAEACVRDHTTRAQRALVTTAGGAIVEVAGGDKSETAGGDRTDLVGALAFSKARGALTMGVGGAHSLDVGGLFKVDAKKSITLTGPLTLTLSAATASLTGAQRISLQVGDTSLILEPSAIRAGGCARIAMTVSGTNNQGAAQSVQI